MTHKKLMYYLFHRTAVIGLLLLVQLALLGAMIKWFSDYFIYAYFLCVLLSIVEVLIIVNRQDDPGYKIAWIVPILLAPLFGGLFYLLCGGGQVTSQTKRKLADMDRHMKRTLDPDRKAQVLTSFGQDAVNQARYLENIAYCPLYTNTYTKYFPLGDEVYEPLLEELRKAKNYIFLEYFIITPGKFWNSVLEILEEKAKDGVDVRVIYDDMGCLYTLPKGYDKELEKRGVRCRVFNRFRPVLSVRLNNRDHRKICVVDGHTAFTGGFNLADEYINEVARFGHWKDSAILLKGEGAWSVTVMFLAMWEYVSGEKEHYQDFRAKELPPQAQEGKNHWVQPYTDSPLDGDPVGATVYMNLINKAKNYVYIMTPYLIISDSMNTALRNAAKSGVDVRIMTPHIPDKKTVFEMTRAHYLPLLEAGVKIYEYTPGFLHAKSFAVDDLYGTVGTVNMDYRSLFLHFENGVWLCGDPTVLDIKQDFLETLKVSEEITLERARAHRLPRLLFRAVLRIFAPLM